MRLDPFWSSFTRVASLQVGVTCLLSGVAVIARIPHGSPQLFRGLGQAGIGLLIAYSVAIAAGGDLLDGKLKKAAHRDWLGFVTGVAICGLVGAGLGFGVAEHRAAGHGNVIDYVGLSWAVWSIVLLGLIVASQAYFRHAWRNVPPPDRWRIERLRSDGSRGRGPGA